MVDRLVTVQAFGGHHAQRPAGPLAPQTLTLHDEPLDDSTGETGDLEPLIPFSAYANESDPKQLAATFVGHVRNDVPSNLSVAAGGTTSWSIQGAYENNNGGPTIGGVFNQDQGRNAPSLRVKFGGDALTAARNTGALVDLEGTLVAGYNAGLQYQTLAQFAEFQSEPPDTHYTAADLITRVTRLFQVPPNTYRPGVDLNNNQIELRGCGYSALAPDCVCYVDPADIGSGPGQIPTAVSANTAAAFRSHPGAFFRRTQYTRSLARVYRDNDTVNASTVGQPVRIVTVDSQPATSDWLLIFDGVPMVVTLGHGGQDYRRPRDIWNGVVIPFIYGAANLESLVLLNTKVDGNVVANASQLRPQFLEYGRCLRVGGSNTSITQTGGLPQ